MEKYYSVSKKYRKSGLIKSRYNLKRKFSSDNETATTSHEPAEELVVLLDEDEVYADVEWLRYNQSPIETVWKKWENTFHRRRADILNINVDVYESWPVLKQNIAITVVSIILFQ